MKNDITTQGLTLNAVLKFWKNVFRSVFESGNNRDFKRLKDYISS